MEKIFPAKLKRNDEIRIVAPSTSLSIISEKTREIANKKSAEAGLRLTFGKYVEETDDFGSSSIEHRIKDIHDAFSDSKVKGIITVIGGFNSNQLLRYLDWSLIKKNPKVFCGYSDITALNNAIYAKTGLVTYSGPFYSTFGNRSHSDYRSDYFQKCLFQDEPFELYPGDTWSDDEWWLYKDEPVLMPNSGWLVINEGEAQGTILGSNLCTFNLLQGTEYFPDLENTVLFLEDDYESLPRNFDRDLQSLVHLPGFFGVKGIVIGRFQKKSEMTKEKLSQIVKTKRELNNIPVLANVDFGHTEPRITFPIGGELSLKVVKANSQITIIKH